MSKRMPKVIAYYYDGDEKDVELFYLGTDKCTYYPFGLHLRQNLPIVLLMVRAIKKQVKKLNPELDMLVNLWCRGSSGAMVAGIISAKIPNSRVMHIKKSGESSHDSDIPSHTLSRNHINIIVDDFVASGNTVNEIARGMKSKRHHIHGLCVSSSVQTSKLEFRLDWIICGYAS